MTSRTRVLLVDDEPGLAELLARQLTRAGFDARGVESLDEAAAAHAAAPFEVLVTDLDLPDGDGAWFARELGARVCLALTGSANPARIAALRTAGFAEVLLKPVTADRLGAAIRAALGRSSPPGAV